MQSKFKEILQEEDSLNAIVQLVGRDALSEGQKLILEVAKIIREDYLQQNAFSDYDYNCPLYKSILMMKAICHFYNVCDHFMNECAANGKTLTYARIKNSLTQLIYKITSLKFENPKQPREELEKKVNDLCNEVENAVHNLAED